MAIRHIKAESYSKAALSSNPCMLLVKKEDCITVNKLSLLLAQKSWPCLLPPLLYYYAHIQKFSLKKKHRSRWICLHLTRSQISTADNWICCMSRVQPASNLDSFSDGAGKNKRWIKHTCIIHPCDGKWANVFSASCRRQKRVDSWTNNQWQPINKHIQMLHEAIT